MFGADCDHDGVAECTFHMGRVARVAGDEDVAQERFAESEEMYRVVQLNFTQEIDVFCMMFDRDLSIFTMTSVKKAY